ncbi:DMT family transporter [Klebsiella pneumoniae]|uniref:DMT family transporter n=1 Tax=Klebsiella pneumoniae TaxID=573 RepID=UPI000F610B47|nr:SMR family transporter [Klebsiella pneumoniae]RRF26894.1 QacE family quaternary ammonium compound efflux SMR transporter [Klebsiella pneumoniae]
MNGWMYLVIAGIAEVFYAASMLRTEGFTRIYPSIFCLTFIGVSMYFLSLATRTIPVGTAYGLGRIGALGTAAYGIIYLNEDKGLLRIACFD